MASLWPILMRRVPGAGSPTEVEPCGYPANGGGSNGSLIGHYDSPFVRRVGVSLHILGMPFERQLLSVFSHADAVRAYNPVGRVPALVLEDGEVLVDSAAILDHLDEVAGPERALMPASGKARRDALQSIVLATGINDKAVAIVYEGRNRGDAADAGWIARCRGQQDAALAALEARFAAEPPGGGSADATGNHRRHRARLSASAPA